MVNKFPRIVPDRASTAGDPPPDLGAHGTELWRRVTAEYDIDDVSGREFLWQVCRASDRAAELAACVAQEGVMIRGRNGLRVHPAIREELAYRSFIVRTLQRLGLNFEPLRALPGRPPGT